MGLLAELERRRAVARLYGGKPSRRGLGRRVASRDGRRDPALAGPITSKAQWRYLFAAQKRGEIPAGTADRMARETSTPYELLPERAS